MLDTYRMVLVNITALSFLLLFIVVIYYYFKLKIKGVFLVLIFSILPLISMLRKGAYESGDFTLQIYRAIDFYNSLSQGIIFPQWGAELNATFGHPIFQFAAPFPYYVISFFHFLDFSFISSTKLLLAFGFILSGLTMYFFVRKYWGEKAGIIAALFYQFTPYHLVDLHFRVSIGDTLAFAFYPLAFLFSTKLLNKFSYLDFTLLSLTILLLVTSHPITIYALIFLAIYILFQILTTKPKMINIIYLFLSMLAGTLMSAIYWFPLLIESRYTYEANTFKEVQYTSILELLYSPYRFGLLFQGPYGELSFLIGYAQLFVIGVAIYFLLKSKFTRQIKSIVALLVISIIVISFLITPFSSLIWDNFTILKSLKISYRLLFIIVFAISLLAGITLANIKNKWILGLIILFAISVTILNWGHRKTIPDIDDNYLKLNLPYATYQIEGSTPSMPIWRDYNEPWEKEIPEKTLETISGVASIEELEVTQNSSTYIVENQYATTLKRNVIYFPGWKIYKNGKEIEVNYEKEGLLEFNVPPGLHLIEIKYIDTTIRFVAKLLFFSGIFVIFLVFFIKKVLKYAKNH